MDKIPEAELNRYIDIMFANDEQHRAEAGQKQPVPMCHFTPMEFHDCDSDPSGRSDGYCCVHCGHSEDSAEAWAKVEARNPS